MTTTTPSKKNFLGEHEANEDNFHLKLVKTNLLGLHYWFAQSRSVGWSVLMTHCSYNMQWLWAFFSLCLKINIAAATWILFSFLRSSLLTAPFHYELSYFLQVPQFMFIKFYVDPRCSINYTRIKPSLTCFVCRKKQKWLPLTLPE